MKEIIIGLFPTREDAEKTIQQLHKDAGIKPSEMSYMYKTVDGESEEINAEDIVDDTPAEGAQKGGVIGGSIGAAIGIATIVGAIPVIGPVFAAGPIVSALGLGAGALGTTAAGALTGAAAGSLIGALAAWGAPEDVAHAYEKRVLAGDILVAVHTDRPQEVHAIMATNNAFDINEYTLTI